MSRHADRLDLAERLYRVALLAFPHRIRTEHGQEMAEMFSGRWREARSRGRWDAVGYLMRTLTDAVVNGVVARAGWGGHARAVTTTGGRATTPRTTTTMNEGEGTMERWANDVRMALRSLIRDPAVTTVALLTLALGIGGATAIYSIVHAAYVADLPFPDGNEVVVPYNAPSPSEGLGFAAFSAPFARAIAEQGVLAAVAAVVPSPVTVGGDERAERVDGARVEPAFFDVARVPPSLGRGFGADDARPGAPEVAVLSRGLWTRAFAGDPAVVGRTVRIDDQPTTIVGVMPQGFELGLPDVDVWRPLRVDPASAFDATSAVNNNRRLVARVPADAAGDPEAIARLEDRLQEAVELVRSRFPEALSDGHGIHLVPLRRHLYGAARGNLTLLMGAVGLVLLIACANLANLLLVRAEARRGALSIRAALGADRARLFRGLLLESVVLSLMGGAAGLGVGWALLAWAGPLAPDGVPVPATTLDPGVVLFALGVALATGVVFGVLPARGGARADLQGVLREGGRGGDGRARGRLRSTLVVVEVALTAVLLSASGLVLNSLWRLQGVDPGFEPAGRTTASLDLPAGRYPDATSLVTFYRRLVDATLTQPGVEAVGLAQTLPLTPGSNWRFEAEGSPTADGLQVSDYTLVSPGYFGAMGIEVVAGRDLEWSDADQGAPPAVMLSRSLADRLWPDGSAVGRRINVDIATRVWREIVGVASDVHHESLESGASDVLYFPPVSLPMASPRGMSVVVRGGRPDAVRTAVADVDPSVPLSDLRALDTLVSGSESRRRFMLFLLASFTTVALILAAVGLYGVVAYAVSLRTREIGLRMAIGAQRSQVLTLVLRQTVLLVAAGTALGLAAALALGGVLESLLYEVDAADPLTLAGVAVFMALIAGVASAAPGWRAARVDPGSVLRQ